VLLAVALFAARVIIGFVGAIDWQQVGAALGRLAWWQLLVLTAMLLVRQTLNAVPLARFVPGLGLGRSMQNDLGAVVIGTLSPPPSDVVLRVSMFRSWGVDPVFGMAGVTLNMFVFYGEVPRPALGLLLLAWEARAGPPRAASALVPRRPARAPSRGDALASLVGRTAGRVVARPPQYRLRGACVVDFEVDSTSVRRGMPPCCWPSLMVPSTARCCSCACVSSGGGRRLDVLAALGVPAGYLLTLMPLVGFGILDAALVAAYVEVAGLELEAEIVAGLVVWRVFTILGPLALGGAVVARWRGSSGRAQDDEVDDDAWDAQLRAALAVGDGERLTVLFDEAVERWGREAASRHWWRVLSAYDAGAQTG
jgi:hypothetical protein